MFKKLDEKNKHTGCSRCNYFGCISARGKHGEVLGHWVWLVVFNFRELKKKMKAFLASITSFDLDYSKIEDIEVDNVHTWDAPDFCDAYISAATYRGREMTSKELDKLNQDSDFVYAQVESKLY